MRDDFPRQTITEIAKGVGFRCSNPECGRPTVGANEAQDGLITIGVAAHICAASPGGPRYSATQTAEIRRGKDNGIWLCQSCGKIVDDDSEKFTVEVLTAWKRRAQTRAFRELVAPSVAASTEEADRISSILAAARPSAADASFDILFSAVRLAAATDLAAYKRGQMWSSDSIELTLRLYDDQNAPTFNISKLPLAVEVAPEVTIVAGPGTGKTTTLLQLSGHVLAASSIVPLYFRLGDWSASSLTLLTSLHQRSAFKEISQDDVLQLAQRGRLLLLLDGWNELDPPARSRLRIELEQIRRDCPDVRIVVTTRRQALDVPTSGPRIVVEPLSEDQEMAIVRAQFREGGEKIVDDAWRTPGVRELITTPLYLSTLLSGGVRGPSPTTKEEVLRLFVQQHERASDHAEALQAMLFGCHHEVLTALASDLNAAGTTTMSDADARRIVSMAVTRLRQQGLIAARPEPIAVLDLLASHHTLMRPEGGTGAIAFQHQQFQEWYASQEVAELMRLSSTGDAGARVRLRAAVLDQPAWEESIFFAVERVSREDGGATVVAHAVRLALPIDPMLAAEMIYRALPAVWEMVKDEVIALVDRWHSVGTADRAVRFMIITGRPEFASRVWPLASSPDSQVQLPTLRTAPRFRPSVLGPDLPNKIAILPEKSRQHLLGLIASESGVDGMDLATELAKADPSPKVQAEVVQSLQFRRADRHVASLLRVAESETWAIVAKRGYADEIRDPTLAKRLGSVRDKAIGEATNPIERLGLLLEQSPDYPERDARITAVIADAGFPVRDQHGGSILYHAQERAPAALLQGLRQRLEAGLKLPIPSDDFVKQLEVTDDGPLAAAILDTSSNERNLNVFPILAGPKTVAALVDKYLDCAKALKGVNNDRGLSERYHRLRSRIAATRASSLMSAVLAHADAGDPELISALASLISLHGDDDNRKLPLPVDPGVKAQLISILRKWVAAVISSPNSKRHDLNEVSSAIGRLGLPELLPELKQLLDEDLARLKNAIAARPEALRRGDTKASSDAATRYGNQYQAAFARLGGQAAAEIAAEYLEDRIFGFNASLILKTISDRQLNLAEPDFRRHWPWFDGVTAARLKRGVSRGREPANAFAVPIFAAIDRLTEAGTDKEGELLAVQLARIALAMPHSDQDALIARVTALPQPLRAKRELFAAIALDGQVLDVDVIMQALDEWLAEAPKHEWQNRQNTWEIEPWLELLPFTNRPEAVLDGLTKVKAFYAGGWEKHWERVLTAVAGLPGAEGEALLGALARRHKDIAGDFEWMKAILGLDSPSAVLLYVDLYLEGTFGTGANAVDAWRVGRELAPYARKFPQVKAELQKRYETVAGGPAQAMLEHLFGEIGDDHDLVAMVKKYAATGRRYDGGIARAVRAVALREEPLEDGSNSFYIHPASVAKIRRVLFGLVGGSPREDALANRCLTELDVLRDDYGIAANDPRHPDVMSEIPWPPETEPPLPKT